MKVTVKVTRSEFDCFFAVVSGNCSLADLLSGEFADHVAAAKKFLKLKLFTRQGVLTKRGEDAIKIATKKYGMEK